MNVEVEGNTSVREYVRLTKLKRAIEENIKAVNRELAICESAIVADFAANGIQSVNCDGMTVYVKRERYVNKLPNDMITMEGLAERLRENGFSYLVAPSYAPSTLKKVLLDMIDDGQTIPEPIMECIEITEATKLVARVS